MSNRIYDSSQLTKRKAEQAIAGSFLTRIGPPNNTTGYGPLPGIYDSSVMNAVKTGHMTEYTRYPTCVGISPGCPSCVPISTPALPAIYGWIAFIFGSTGNSNLISSQSYGIADGSIIITGQFSNTVTLYDATTTGSLTARTTITSIATGTGVNAFIAKYDTNGIFQWVTTLTTTGTASGLSMTSDASNIYVTGSFKGDLNVYNGSSTGPVGSPALILTNSVSNSGGGFLLSFNKSGTFMWGTKFINTSAVIALQSRSITLLGTDLYIGGIFTDGVDLYNAGNPPTVVGSTLVSNSASTQGFLVKYTTSGVFSTSATMASPQIAGLPPIPAGQVEIYSVTSDGTNIYATGFVKNTGGSTRTISYYNSSNLKVLEEQATMTNNTQNGFVVKYNSNFTSIASTLIRNTLSDALPTSISASATNVYVTGYFGIPPLTAPIPGTQTVSFSSFRTPPPTTLSIPTPTASLSSTTITAGFIVSYKISDGTVEWVNLIGGGSAGVCSPNTILFNNNNIYLITNQAAFATQLYNANGTGAPIASSLSISFATLYGFIISKYNTTGQLTWATKIETIGTGIFSSNLILSGNDMYITGTLSGQSAFYDANGLSGPSSTPFLSFTPSISPPLSQYSFLAKYNSNTGQLTN